jgi:hypothetical protein
MRWKHRPEGSNWGEFGADDETGRLNLITPEKVLQGIAEVKEGAQLLPVAAARLSGRQYTECRAPSAAAACNGLCGWGAALSPAAIRR